MNRRLLITGGSGFIGTNLVAAAIAAGEEVTNVDLEPPADHNHVATWTELDLLDRDAVTSIVSEVAPSHVVHLAARTDLGGGSVEDYAVNTSGTANLLDALDAVGSVERTIFTSSLLVCRNGYVPASDTDYCPTTPYGESKQRTEELVRSWRPAGPWVIVRPTSIWGPWFGEPYRPFVERVRRGRYLHPGRREVPKALGFVGNTVAQIRSLLDAPAGAVEGRTFYLADSPPYSIRQWADAIAVADQRRAPPTGPLALLRLAGRVGDVAQRVGLWPSPPLTSLRVENMVTASRFDTSDLDRLSGPLPYDLEAGVCTTLRWLDEHAN